MWYVTKLRGEDGTDVFIRENEVRYVTEYLTFEVGDTIEVRDECGEWRKATFLGSVDHEYKFVALVDLHTYPVGWKFARHLQKDSEVVLTLSEIADKLDIDVDKLRIKD